MKNTFISLLVLFGGFQLFAQSIMDPDDALLELTGDRQNTGITAGYSVKGITKWTGSAGYACLEDKRLFSIDTPTRIASISKNLTAVALMQLVEKGMMNLDTPIGNYLPNLPEDKKEITVRQLMSHTSGIPQYRDESEIENTAQFASLEAAMKVFIDRPLLFEPGTSYFYTTYGYVILGRVIESVSGLPYREYMKTQILEVAGMTHTGIEGLTEDRENASCLYHNNGRKVRKGKKNNLSNRVPGGGFYSTLEDLIAFGNALLDGRLISQESLEAMLEIQPVEYKGNKYGLGWYLYGPPPNENLVIGHSGGQTGCTSQLMIIPKSETVVVVLSNTSGTYPDIATFASKLIGFSEAPKKG
ncbi:CubicO group peptidase, beta-lactamase class C family [Muriicola jejuensis]|uniref:Serine hydrolase n=1 Tax=Muriicola jejuensis TaxID=504488 RepID=A0A6P0UHY5_9FLAO|nr:serine hydrolase domain-containing protein [Muriicola jejuensis]NER11448.1 serine hydrolase [Muriicola jejuensis]SMP20725.1 CubicO group peptidase, beta-lactamase class C family [Muriicola jejuensis]